MDAHVVEWLNAGVGKFGLWDAFMKAVMSDYFAPVTGSLVLLALWFYGKDEQERYRNQLATVIGAMSVGFANLGVVLVNNHYFRPRPFAVLDVQALFYMPTDSSFPSNVAGVGFAIATAVFLRHRKLGAALYALALLWSSGRVYSAVHYPTDILAGAAMGVAAVLLSWMLVRVLAFVPRLVLGVARTLYLA